MAYENHIKQNGKMLVTLAGAMSTAELGISLAEMIRKDMVHAICTTGANLEEDLFNLVAHKHYKLLPKYRELSAKDELDLLQQGFNRVTDTCIPEEQAMHVIGELVFQKWQMADQKNESYFPHEFLYQILTDQSLVKNYQIDPKDSWMLAACEKNLPIFTPGWEDSTLGNFFVAHHIKGDIKNLSTVKSGLHAMKSLVEFYDQESLNKTRIGFFQIGGGIAGDFPICAVPLLRQDLQKDVPLWAYFCQISDSTTSFGSYSGAHPNEKITWGKLDADTPKFIIESDATIVAPLIFEYLLDSKE